MEAEEKLLPIDLRLRFVFFGLECALGVSFSGHECERVFQDAIEDQQSAKSYEFFKSAGLVVSGRVDEYEAETLWLRVQGARHGKDLIQRVAEGAEFHVFRLNKSRD